MSIEQEVQSLTAAVKELTAVIAGMAAPVIEGKPVKAGKGSTAAPAVQPSIPTPAPAVAVPAAMTPMFPPAAPAVPAMPAMPDFAAPVLPAATVSGVPFTDGAGLLKYVMDVYKEVGAQKGSGIQAILTGLGYANVNDVRPEHYAAFHGQIEALRK